MKWFLQKGEEGAEGEEREGAKEREVARLSEYNQASSIDSTEQKVPPPVFATSPDLSQQTSP